MRDIDGVLVESERDVHAWFGLTYASYLVLPRVVLQAMPDDWQERFVALLDELDAHLAPLGFDWPGYTVQPRRNGRFAKERLPHYRHATKDLGELARLSQGDDCCPSCHHPWEQHSMPGLGPLCTFGRSGPDASDGCRCARPRPAVVL